MTELEIRLKRLETLMRVIVENQRPQITFGEIRVRLGHNNSETTRRWIKAHKLERVGPRAYRLLDYVNAATRPSQ